MSIEIASTNDALPDIKQNKKTKKGDEMRNLYPNLMKVIINSLKAEKGVYRSKILKIRKKVLVESDYIPVEIEEFEDFCRSLEKKEFSLKNLYSFMNFDQAEGKEKTLKKIFQQFVEWFLDRRYSVHIITSDQCEHKEKYLKGKNMLRYLPSVRSKRGH